MLGTLAQIVAVGRPVRAALSGGEVGLGRYRYCRAVIVTINPRSSGELHLRVNSLISSQGPSERSSYTSSNASDWPFPATVLQGPVSSVRAMGD